MSETYSRARISRVQVAAHSPVIQNASPVAEAIQPLLGVASIALIGLLAGAAKKALTQENNRVVEPIVSLRQTFQFHQTENLRKLRQTAALSQPEALQIATVAALQQTPFLVSDPTVLKPLLDATAGKSLGAVRDAIKATVTAIEESHFRVLQNSLVLACTNASIAAGFPTIECVTGMDNTTRIIATHPSGRTLVSEVTASKDSEPKIETEVVGVTDDRCHQIIDEFDKALEAQGVRSWGPPQRKFTGGVVELSASKEFIRSKRSKEVSKASTASLCSNDRSADARKRQLRNRRQTQKQR